MAIDTKPFVEFGKRFYNQFDSTHYEGCVYHHPECAILYLAGALDAAQKRLDEYAAEIERLRDRNADLEQYIKKAIGDISDTIDDLSHAKISLQIALKGGAQ